MTDERRRIPAWLVGLILGAILTGAALFVLDRLGYGDEPAVGADSMAARPAAVSIFSP